MGEHYVPIYYDWPEATSELADAEKGRLMDAIILYARGGDWQSRVQGVERFVLPTFMAQIDRAKASQELRASTSRENGRKGGRPRKKAVEAAQGDDNPFAEGDARPAANTIEAYVDSNLGRMTPGNWEELASYCTDMSDALIRCAVDDACSHGARSWAYVKRVLNSYLQHGFKTVGDVKAFEDARQDSKRQTEQGGPKLRGNWY